MQPTPRQLENGHMAILDHIGYHLDLNRQKHKFTASDRMDLETFSTGMDQDSDSNSWIQLAEPESYFDIFLLIPSSSTNSNIKFLQIGHKTE